MAQEKRIKVDVEKVRKAIESGIPLTVTTYTLPHEIEEYACDILKTFLTELDQAQMADSLIYCLKELANNGKIIRPAYKSIAPENTYVPMNSR